MELLESEILFRLITLTPAVPDTVRAWLFDRLIALLETPVPLTLSVAFRPAAVVDALFASVFACAPLVKMLVVPVIAALLLILAPCRCPHRGFR